MHGQRTIYPSGRVPSAAPNAGYNHQTQNFPGPQRTNLPYAPNSPPNNGQHQSAITRQLSYPRQENQVSPAPPPQDQRLDEAYKVRIKPKRFFAVGKVFITLWTEPAGGSRDQAMTVDGRNVFEVQYAEAVFSKVRRFIVVSEGEMSCVCVAIHTYTRATNVRPDVERREHAIVYTGRKEPSPEPGEQRSALAAIRVEPETSTQLLDARSRINFGKLFTIEHNLKVKPWGTVDAASKDALIDNVRKTLLPGRGPTRSTATYQRNTPYSLSNNGLHPAGPTNAQLQNPKTSVPIPALAGRHGLQAASGNSTVKPPSRPESVAGKSSIRGTQIPEHEKVPYDTRSFQSGGVVNVQPHVTWNSKSTMKRKTVSCREWTV